MKKKNRGFTLIELLVVVLIIGILAAVALPQYQKAIAKSRLRLAQSLVKQMWQGIEAYRIANNEYPDTPDQLDIDFPPPTSTTYSESLKRTYLYYGWGECQFHGGAGVGCLDDKSGIGYQETALSNGQKLKECKAKKKSVSVQICQNETGKSTSDYDAGSWVSYNYPN